MNKRRVCRKCKTYSEMRTNASNVCRECFNADQRKRNAAKRDEYTQWWLKKAGLL